MFPGGNGGRKLPYHPHVAIVMKSGRLNLLEPTEIAQACNNMARSTFWNKTEFSRSVIIWQVQPSGAKQKLPRPVILWQAQHSGTHRNCPGL